MGVGSLIQNNFNQTIPDNLPHTTHVTKDQLTNMKSTLFKIILSLFLFASFNYCRGQKTELNNNIDLNRTDVPEIIKSFINNISYSNLSGYKPVITFKKISDNILKINLVYNLTDTLLQDDWQLMLNPSFNPVFNWDPHLTPEEEFIISQHSFRSPAMIVSDSSKQLVVIPDLDIMSKGTPVKWYMDMDAVNNKLTLGMSNYKIKEIPYNGKMHKLHVLYVRDTGAVYPKGKVEFGFYIMAFNDKGHITDPWREPLDFLWKNWGKELYESGQPADSPLKAYVDHTYDWAFNKWKTNTWQEFEINGKKAGSFAYKVDISMSPNYTGEVTKMKYQTLWNQAWFSSLRSASGLFRYGKRTNNNELMEKARLTKELALAFPQKNGFFNAVIATKDN